MAALSPTSTPAPASATLAEMQALLAEAPFFRDFPPALLGLVAPYARSESFRPGQYLIHDGDPAASFFLIRYGTVAIELAAPPTGRITLQTIGEGELLGWSWLTPPYRWSFDGVAVTLVRTVCLDADGLRAACDANHELGYHLLRRMVSVMAGRLTAARLQMLDLYGPPPGAGV